MTAYMLWSLLMRPPINRRDTVLAWYHHHNTKSLARHL